MSRGEGAPVIAVVGAGAVGGYLGGRLIAAGHDVRFLVRGESLAALRLRGLHVADGSGEWSVPDVRAWDDPADIGEVDVVLLCVKTWQLPAAVDALPPLIGENTAVVTVQNGVEAPEQVAARVGRGKVLPGTVRIVATADGPGAVRQAGPPAAVSFTEWDSSVSARVERLRKVLRDASLTAPETRDIWADLWTKFLLVVPIGSMGAATGGATVGELRSRAGTRRTLVAAMREIHRTAVALGVALPEDAVDTATALMDRQAAHVCTSLQRDLLEGRPSELEAWTGAAVRLAAKADQSAPVLETLYEVLAMAASRTVKDV